MTIDYRVGDVRDIMATIPDGSVSLVATSPPFLALRSYLPAGHEHKHREIGSEANPAAFLDTLLELTAEWGRVLAPWGSIAIELGDTYSGSGPGTTTTDGLDTSDRLASRVNVIKGSCGWPQAKSLALIPQLYAIALAYGINPLTAQPSPAGRWRVRNVIVWHRPNPAVGALGDKYRPSTSYITVATRSKDRWFDLTAVRTALKVPEAATPKGARPISVNMGKGKNATDAANVGLKIAMSNPAGAPPLDTWTDHHDTELRPPRRIAMRDHRRHPDHVEPAMLTSYITVATRSKDRWFDLTAVRNPNGGEYHVGLRERDRQGRGRQESEGFANPAGAPPLDCWLDDYDLSPGGEAGLVSTDDNSPGGTFHDTWTLTTQPSSLAHYAMWPARLAQRLILSMSPLEVCTVCGEPRRRMEVTTNALGFAVQRTAHRLSPDGAGDGRVGVADISLAPRCAERETLGWTECACKSSECPCGKCSAEEPHLNKYRPGVVLDPFAGTGTTLAVAELHGRDSIGIDIDPRNRALLEPRMTEVKRALFGTTPELPGQLELLL